MGFWRTKARQIIHKALLEAKAKGLRGRAIRRHITKFYPEYGHPRCKYPYRVWLDEVDTVMEKELSGYSQMVLGLSRG